MIRFNGSETRGRKSCFAPDRLGDPFRSHSRDIVEIEGFLKLIFVELVPADAERDGLRQVGLLERSSRNQKMLDLKIMTLNI